MRWAPEITYSQRLRAHFTKPQIGDSATVGLRINRRVKVRARSRAISPLHANPSGSFGGIPVNSHYCLVPIRPPDFESIRPSPAADSPSSGELMTETTRRTLRKGCRSTQAGAKTCHLRLSPNALSIRPLAIRRYK